MSDRLRIYVLGRFRLYRGDTALSFAPRLRKPQELLQALIALGGSEVNAGVLTDALWPDSDGDAAYHALESALYRLRQLLDARDAVRMHGGKVTLERERLWVDLWAVEEELRRCDEPKGTDPASLERLRALYQGHFLQQETEKPWILKTRHALRDRLLRTISDAARNCELKHEWREAARLYRFGIELESLNEGLYRGLMRCHQQLGDHGEALQAYRRCRELLTSFLGIAPNATTQALYHSVRAGAAYGMLGSGA